MESIDVTDNRLFMVQVGSETRSLHLLAILRTVVEEEISPQPPRTTKNRICTYAKDYLRAFIKLIAKHDLNILLKSRGDSSITLLLHNRHCERPFGVYVITSGCMATNINLSHQCETRNAIKDHHHQACCSGVSGHHISIPRPALATHAQALNTLSAPEASSNCAGE